MRRASKLLPASLSLASKRHRNRSTPNQPTIIKSLLFSTTNKSSRDSLILDQFKRRHQKGSLKPAETASSSSIVKEHDEKGSSLSPVSGFQGLGLREEMIAAAEEMMMGAPNEIQCVGIPAVLDGKCVVLSSESGPVRTIAYLLPLLQLLRQDEALVRMKSKHPRGIVLCTTEELSDECFRMAKFISDQARLKRSRFESKGHENSPDAPLGLLVGTPSEILEQMEEGHIFCGDIKYMVLDEADAILSHGFGPIIRKMVSRLQNPEGIQTILVTSPVTEMLCKQLYPVMERLEQNHTGQVAAMLLEMDRTEAFDLLASADILKKKVAEAMASIRVDAQGS